jgi:hypothetical protein
MRPVTGARSPLEVLIDAAQVIDQLAFLGVCVEK